MTSKNKQPHIDYCSDSELSYKKYQTTFDDGCGLEFDDNYRLAHLPLVAPDHPRVILTKTGSRYSRGVHDLIYSMAIPIPANSLLGSEKFIELYEEIKATKFAHKISWDTFAQRKNVLHATICGTLSTGQAPYLDKHVYQRLSAIGPLNISIRGMFSGNINVGRLYLKVYPELRNGQNMCHEIQEIVGSPFTDLYVVGLFNFVEELDASEAQVLRKLLDRWWDIDIIQLRLDNLWLVKSRDDLVLDGDVDQIISLV